MNTTSNFDEPVLYKKGSVIFVEGEPSSFLFLIRSGKVKIVKENNNRLIPISTLGEQSFLGELSMFSESPRSATAVAVEDTEAMIVKKTEITKALKVCPDWVVNIVKTLCDRLRSTDEILREHRIVNDSEQGLEFEENEERELIDAIEEYRSRRGISKS